MTTTHHQLSAIMFTDIVGYTSMMGRDEAKALELLRQNRKIHKTLIEKYNGTWIKEMGDGVLARFDSAYYAVRCAIEIQEATNSDFKGQLHIGLHIGDVFVEDNDIFGDGVNIAARIESIADPGAIYLSGAFQNSIQNHTDIRTRYLAKTLLKNVLDPVAIHCIDHPGIALPTKNKIRKLKGQTENDKTLVRRLLGNPVLFLLLAFFIIIYLASKYWFNNSPNRTVKTIAVMPFTNLTGNDEEQYFVEGIHRAVTTEISRIGELMVRPRASTLQFRDTNMPLTDIARILDVDAILEGSVFKAGDSLYMNVQLIKTRPKEYHIWAAEFLRDTRHIVSFYGELARSIAGEIEIQLTPREEKLLTHDQEVNTEAYKAFMKGQYQWQKLNKEGLDSAEYYYKRSMEIDPNFALSYAGLASVSLGRAQSGIQPFYEASISGIKYLEKAIELDSTSDEIFFSKAAFNIWGQWDFEEGERNFKKGLDINPNVALRRVYFALLLCYQGNCEEAITQGRYSLRQDPLTLLVKGIFGQVLNNCRKYEQADSLFNVVLEKNPFDAIALSNLKTTYHMQGKYAEAYELWRKDNRNDPEALDVLAQGYEKGGYTAALENLADLMVERSKTRFVTPWRICTLYTRAGMKDKALTYLEKAYDVHDQNMPYIISDPIFDFLRDEPRFQIVIDKMNFPVSH